MSETTKYRPPHHIWNFELAFVMYCGGMLPEDILKHEAFRGMNPQSLHRRISEYGWAKRKEEVSGMDKTSLLKASSKRLQEELEKEALTHQGFMLSEIRRERRIAEDRDHDETIKGQLGRLEVLDRLDTMARKLTRLDEKQDVNPITSGFAFLVSVATTQNSSQLEAIKTIPLPPEKYTPSAIIPLPEDQDHSTGIIRSNNAMPDSEEDPEITEEPSKPREMPTPGNLFGTKPL
jgi:hypothetical protein